MENKNNKIKKILIIITIICVSLSIIVGTVGCNFHNSHPLADKVSTSTCSKKPSNDNNHLKPTPYQTQKERKVIKSIYAHISPEQTFSSVILSGIPFDDSSVYFTDLKIEICTHPKITITPNVDSGYSADITAYDFLGNGYEQIFFASSTGGSGGFGNYYVYDVSTPKVQVLFASDLFPNHFSAQYGDNFTANVLKDGKPFIAYDLSSRSDLAYMWDNNGKFIGTEQPSVSDVNFVEPAYTFTTQRYRLNIWQKVTGTYQADTYGYIITTIDLKENYTLLSIYSDLP